MLWQTEIFGSLAQTYHKEQHIIIFFPSRFPRRAEHMRRFHVWQVQVRGWFNLKSADIQNVFIWFLKGKLLEFSWKWAQSKNYTTMRDTHIHTYICRYVLLDEG